MYGPARSFFLLSILVFCLVALIGCGSGSSITGQGPGLGNGSNNAMLQGQYAFALSGQQTNGQPFFDVGSFTADGQGHLGGNEDVITSNVQTGSTGTHFAGTYAVGSDGRGNAVVGLQPGCANWQFTMLSHAHALLTCLNTNMTGSGTIDLQDPRAFSTSALKGNYVFGFSGLGATGAPAATAGNWLMDGAGNITTGQIDINDLASSTAFQDISLSGTYSVSSSGRGTATISSSYATGTSTGTQNFVFYVVNATDIKFMEIDPLPVFSGEVLSQAAGPFTAGKYAFMLGGSDGVNPIAFGGVLPVDGNGNVTSGALDVNYGGSTSIGGSLGGTYIVNATGRGLATLNSAATSSFPLAFYRAANGTLELVNLGGAISSASFVVAGMAKVQSGGPFNAHSLNGNYAVNFSGTNLGSTFSGVGEEDISGQLTADGLGTLGGVLDVNNSGSISHGLSVAVGSYTMTPTGQGTASWNAGSGVFTMQTYKADPNTVLFLDIDNNRVMTGLAEKQQF